MEISQQLVLTQVKRGRWWWWGGITLLQLPVALSSCQFQIQRDRSCLPAETLCLDGLENPRFLPPGAAFPEVL